MIAVAELFTERVSVSVGPERIEGMEDVYRPDEAIAATATTINGGLAQAKEWLEGQGWSVGSWHKMASTDYDKFAHLKRWAVVNKR